MISFFSIFPSVSVPQTSEAIVTARSSTKKGENSNDTQLDEGKTAAVKDGHNNPHQYCVVTSAWKVDNLAAILDYINKNGIRIIYTREPDRLSRNTSFWMNFVTHLNHDVELRFTDDEFKVCNAVVGRYKPFGDPYNHSLYIKIYEGQRFAEECSRKGKLSARLKRERKELNENMSDMKISQKSLPDDYYIIDELVDRYKKGNRIIFKVKWVGHKDFSEVYRTSLMEDVPEMVKDFERRMKRLRTV